VRTFVDAKATGCVRMNMLNTVLMTIPAVAADVTLTKAVRVARLGPSKIACGTLMNGLLEH
jgi:hypothetical protein